MASAFDSDEDSCTESDDDVSSTDSDSSDGSPITVSGTQPCKYYNSGGCKDGANCKYSHICKYFLQGRCRYGNSCKLNHANAETASNARSRPSMHPQSNDTKLTDGRPYQWQLDGGNGWKDIANDHIIEAQFSLPHTKSIKIYNTKFGAVSIDFQRLRIYGKNLKVRRLDDGQTTWFWYCILSRKWTKYGEKKSSGTSCPVSSADIERRFQLNSNGSFSFNMGSKTVEIKFGEMKQVSQQKKRKITRRPQFRQKVSRVASGTTAFQNLSIGTKPKWQFEGNNGSWHDFKQRSGASTECSLTSDDIELKFKQNPRDTMTFKVNGQPYKLDFAAMKQTNMKTQRSRGIRRVMV